MPAHSCAGNSAKLGVLPANGLLTAKVVFTGMQDVQQRYQGTTHLDKPLVVLRDICFELVQPYGELRLEAKRLVVSPPQESQPVLESVLKVRQKPFMAPED